MVQLAKSITDLWRLVREAKEDRKPFDDGFAKLEDMYVSRWYGRGRRKGAKSQPENVPFSFAAMMLPHMIQSAPRFLASADGTYQNEVFAAGSQAALNLISKRAQWNRILRPGAFDYLMSYPAFFIEMAPARHAMVPDAMRRRLKGALRSVPEDDERDAPTFQASPMSPAPPHWPALRHVQRTRWGWDLKARVWDEARFLWWETTYGIDQLKDIAEREPSKWRKDQIERLTANTDAVSLGYAGTRSGTAGEKVEDRNEVCVHQVWVPEDELGESPGRGEKGVVYTFVVCSAAHMDVPIEIRPPYYFYGPPTGPLVTGGQFTVSMESVPVNVLMANKEQIDLVNAVAWSVGKRIKEHKRVYAYDMAIDGDIRAMTLRGDGQFQGIAGMVREGQPLIMPVDMGGVDRADIAHYQIALDSLSRNVMGSDEAMRGQVGSGATATEVNAAFNQTFAQIEHIIQGWEQIVVDCGHAVRWYVENDTRFFTFFDQEGKELVRRRQGQQLVDQGALAPQELDVALKRARSTPYPFQGGDLSMDESGQIDPHSVEVRLEVGSLQRRTSAQRRVDEVALNEQLAGLGASALQFPFINWKERVRALGEAWGKSGLEELFDEEAASQIAGIQMAAGMPEARFEGFGDAARDSKPTQPMPQSATPKAGARPGRAKVAAEAAPSGGGM